jgi:putative chitinase
MIDRTMFFAGVRHGPFPGSLTDPQVSGMGAILNEWDRRRLSDNHWLAYMLATAFHETAHTMQPIEEIGHGKGRKYGTPVNGHVYYGRGYVQLTWDYNYKKMGDLLGVDLVSHPELALDPKIAAGIMFEGMERGTFTGKKLADFFNDHTTDWVRARKIINGLDRADIIANYAREFHAALDASATGA